MPRKVFVAGEILTAADVNTNLMDQAVMVFDDATDRATAIPTPVEGMVTYLKDTDSVEKFDGSNFVGVATAPAILQVVSTTLTSVFTVSVAQGAEEEVTGLSVSITPSSASSKILVNLSVTTGATLTNNRMAFVSLFRGATKIALGDTGGSRQRVTTGAGAAGNDILESPNHTFLDAPNTTSATTYSVKISHNNAATEVMAVNRSREDIDSNPFARGASSITVMEVAG